MSTLAQKVQTACETHNNLRQRIAADAQTRYWTAFEIESVDATRKALLALLGNFIEIKTGTWQHRTHGQVKLASSFGLYLYTPASVCVRHANERAFDAAKLDA